MSAGIVHAIGAGAVILEVQEPSDTTFRVWDFDRTDSHGHKRALHLDQALDVARFSNDSAQPPPLTIPTYDGDSALLCETRAFSMRALDLGGREQALRTDGRHAFVLHAEQGDVVLVHDGVELVLPRGASCVIPATCGTVTFPARGAASRVVVMR